MVPKSLTRPTPFWTQSNICRHRSVEQMADKRGSVRRNRGLFTAIQDQVILTRNYKKYILKQLRRRCGKESEMIRHITAACEQLTPNERVDTWWSSKIYPSETGISIWSNWRQKSILKVHSSQCNAESQFQAVLEPQHYYGQNDTF